MSITMPRALTALFLSLALVGSGPSLAEPVESSADPEDLRWVCGSNAGELGQVVCFGRPNEPDRVRRSRIGTFDLELEECVNALAARGGANVEGRICADLLFSDGGLRGRVVGRPEVEPPDPTFARCVARIRGMEHWEPDRGRERFGTCTRFDTHLSDDALSAYVDDPRAWVADRVRDEVPTGTVLVEPREGRGVQFVVDAPGGSEGHDIEVEPADQVLAEAWLISQREQHRLCYAHYVAWWGGGAVDVDLYVLVDDEDRPPQAYVDTSESPTPGREGLIDDCLSSLWDAQGARLVPMRLRFAPE